MKKWVCIFTIVSLCLCSCNLTLADQEEEAEYQVMFKIEPEDEEENEEKLIPEVIEDQTINENDLMQKNREEFYDVGEQNNLADEELDSYYNRLLQDNVFQDGTLQLNSCLLSDIDQNGQTDMIIMVAEGAGLIPAGCIYIYFNKADPYCFQGEVCYGVGFYGCSAGDIDNDGNTELIMEISDGGNGGAGGRATVILKNIDGTFEEMELPEDMGEKYYWEFRVLVDINYEENAYVASNTLLGEISGDYCSPKGRAEERESVIANNSRGFYNYRCVEYNGKNALQCSEYLYGDRGIADGVGSAEFIMIWDEEGNCSVAKWWIEVW